MNPPPEPPEEIKDLDNLTPIDHAVIALPHTPVYKMHRYFARRPWSVFRGLINHYSNPGSIVLDPFCGGGVTIVEGLATGRKVIGVDFNPMATFIAGMEVKIGSLEGLEEGIKMVAAQSREEVSKLYDTSCPSCGGQASSAWVEISIVVTCPACGTKVRLADVRKVGRAKYECPGCPAPINPANAERLRDELTRLKSRVHEMQVAGD